MARHSIPQPSKFSNFDLSLNERTSYIKSLQSESQLKNSPSKFHSTKLINSKQACLEVYKKLSSTTANYALTDQKAPWLSLSMSYISNPWNTTIEPEFSPIHSQNHQANLFINTQIKTPRILSKRQSSQSIVSNSPINKENPDQEKQKEPRKIFFF